MGLGLIWAIRILDSIPASQYLRFLGQTSAAIVTQGGVELPPKTNNQDPGGPNGQISPVGAGPALSSVLREAGPEKMTWLRWEIHRWQAGGCLFFRS